MHRSYGILPTVLGRTIELADSAGINRNYVGQIEREEKSPTVDILEKLTIALEVNAVDLFVKPGRQAI